MPRKVRDSNLETRTARGRLKVVHKPYYRLIEPGLHLGYRKLASGPGTWIARHYTGGGRYVVENLRTTDERLVVADDYSEPDGDAVLSFGQAQERAKALRPGTRKGPYTVNDALDDYLAFLASDGRATRGISDARYRADALIRPKLGEAKVAALTAEQLRRWRDGVAHSGPRLRTRKGDTQKHGPVSGEDAKRARRASANRTWTILRAALNHAFSSGKADTDIAWRKVKPFKSVDAARIRYLSVAEAQRLINAAEPDFRPLVQAALLTGARYGELARLEAQDFNSDAGTIAIRQSKAGKPRHVVLTDEGRGFFAELAAGRAGNEPIFRRQWNASQQLKPMRAAVAVAKIKPAISFHGLRHTWASLAVMNGMPLMVVARNLGHADTRMVEKHYGHLAPSYIADEVRKGAPKFGFKPSKRVVSLK
jgi:integrase